MKDPAAKLASTLGVIWIPKKRPITVLASATNRKANTIIRASRGALMPSWFPDEKPFSIFLQLTSK